jgi:uncharacterized protein involved in tolerance to divalent cations
MAESSCPDHRYEVHEIIALPIVDGNAEYMAWLEKETEMK